MEDRNDFYGDMEFWSYSPTQPQYKVYTVSKKPVNNIQSPFLQYQKKMFTLQEK